MIKTITKLRYKVLLAISAFSLIFVGSVSFAGALTANTTISSNISSVISLLTSSGTVSANVLPTGSGAQTIQPDTVTVSTNDTSGYTLTLASSSAQTALKDTGAVDSIVASSGTTTTPVVEAVNTWGFCVYDAGYSPTGFTGTNCPSSGVSNAAISGTYKFAGVPASGSAVTLINYTAGTASNRVDTVYYGVAVNTSQPANNGAYTNTVTYTATAN
jgi:hypothetical protein